MRVMVKVYLNRIKYLLAKCSFRKIEPISTKKRIVSFTFDDVPLSGIQNGASILNRYNFKGTFYIAFSFLDCETQPSFSASDVKQLYDDGHELACHTFSHPHFFKFKRKKDISSDLDINSKYLKKILPNYKFENFSFPFGEQTIRSKKIASKRFNTCRSNEWGVNVDKVDFNSLKSVRLYEKTVPIDKIEILLDDFSKNGGWLIFYTHDVQQLYSDYGCSENYFERVVNICSEKGIEVLSIKSALEKIKMKKTL